MSTHVRAIHINELRSYIDGYLEAAGHAGWSWSDGNPIGTTTHIRSQHFTEIQAAIQWLWHDGGHGDLGAIPQWSYGSPPSSGRHISARDMNDLRNWLNYFTGDPLERADQGIVSLSVEPSSGGIVDTTWCQDLNGIKPNGKRLYVRINLKLGGDFPGDFNAAVNTWLFSGAVSDVGGVITQEFFTYDSNSYWPNDFLTTQNGLSNPYIDLLVSFVTDFLANVGGVTRFWVWNEPNANAIIPIGSRDYPPGSLAPEVFGCMVYQVTKAIKAQFSDAIVYAGSLSILPGTDPTGPYGAQYLSQLYSYLEGRSVGAFGWDGLSLNVENAWSVTEMQSVIVAIQGARPSSDGNTLVAGEWGFGNPPDATEAQDTFDAVSQKIYSGSGGAVAGFSTMYFYAHQESNESGTDYGLRPFTVNSSGYYEWTGELAWYGVLNGLLQDGSVP